MTFTTPRTELQRTSVARIDGASLDSVADRPMRIAMIAPPWVAVPPPNYGGTEAVVDLLCRGLAAAGHEVVLFASGDSTCPVERRSVYDRPLGTTGHLLGEYHHACAAYRVAGDFDVIHDHTLLGPMGAVAEGITTPLVTTSHGPFTEELATWYRTVGRSIAVIAISHHQRSTAPEVRIADVIHHGVDLDRYRVGEGDGGYVLFLGRMHPDKGAHRAIRIARAAGKRIVLAAKMWEPAERAYFEQQVAPLLGDDAVYIGAVGGQEKVDLLAGAEALVNPIRWAEPFGLVMVEALASGTPVLAFPEGAAPEIVDHGRTGFLCRDEDDMVARLGELPRLDRAACRASAVERFSVERMVDDHVALYRRLAAVSRLPGGGHRPRRPQATRSRPQRGPYGASPAIMHFSTTRPPS